MAYTRWVTKFEARQKASAPRGMFYTPAQVAGLLQISPKAVITRFAEMDGVLVLPDAGEGKRKERERYRQIRISKSVLIRPLHRREH
jgi:hypothetical protein